jgi:hypothetical protein
MREIGDRSAAVQRHIQKKKAGSIAAPPLSPSAARVPAFFATYHPLAGANQTRSRRFCGFWPYREKLSAGRLRLFPVMFDMVLRRFRCVMRGMVKVALSGVRVVRGRLVVSLFMMGRCSAVMTRRVFVVFRCLVMMLCRLLRHSSSSFIASPDSRMMGLSGAR